MTETPCAQSRTACHTSGEKHRNVCSEYLWECSGTDCNSGDAVGLPNVASCPWNHCHLQLPNIASHLVSSELHLPAREAARVSYNCWTVSLLKTTGCLGRQDLPKAQPPCPVELLLEVSSTPPLSKELDLHHSFPSPFHLLPYTLWIAPVWIQNKFSHAEKREKKKYLKISLRRKQNWCSNQSKVLTLRRKTGRSSVKPANSFSRVSLLLQFYTEGTQKARMG